MDDIQAQTAAPAEDPSLEPMPDAVTANRAMAAAADQNGPDAELVECPTCHNQRRKFLIVNGKCDSCRTKDQQSQGIVPELGWPEVRQRRNRIIAGLDWTQLGDVNPDTQTKHATIRQELRDVTTQTDPFTAWWALDKIEAEIAAG